MPHLPPPLAETLRVQCEAHGLSAVHDEIAANTAECIALIADGDDDYARAGNTRFGGIPDLPEGMPWPASGPPGDEQTRFSNFIGQINFAELPRVTGGEALPTAGVLHLFVKYLNSAYEPVVWDTSCFPGRPSELAAREPPDYDRMADEYLMGLHAVRIRAEPAISIAWYRKPLRRAVEQHGGDEAAFAFYDLVKALQPEGQIGQMLGFANAGDERMNLYRKMYLARIGKTDLFYNDYWDSLEAYEAEIASRRGRGEHPLAERYEKMRPGVTWLLENRAAIAAGVAEWRLLLRLDSNGPMGLEVLDADPLYLFTRDADLAARRFDDLPGVVTQG